ncbi:hypothetical protein ERO13_A13G047950v2 [Gossypium hirsutum]|nr:hypothetical protein ERO13_A13G047950v2 [Gossypium hirsutum]TYI99914.1 hypothetical protein E1A91_A13G051200v1 [Gossypium mustelinum]
MVSSVTVPPPYLTTTSYAKPPSYFFSNLKILLLKAPLSASRQRTPNFTSRSITVNCYNDQVVDGDEDEEYDRSLDLLVRFVQNVFRKISKRARKAVRSVLPVFIPSNLVGLSVNGVLILALLWVLTAFLETVLCMQESRDRRIDELVDDQRMWSGAQPAT